MDSFLLFSLHQRRQFLLRHANFGLRHSIRYYSHFSLGNGLDLQVKYPCFLLCELISKRYASSEYSLNSTTPPVPSDESNSSSSLSVHSDLLNELQQLSNRILSNNGWTPVSEIYNALSLTSRRQHLKPFKTLANLLRLYGEKLKIEVSSDLLSVCSKASFPELQASIHVPPNSSTEVSKQASFHNSSNNINDIGNNQRNSAVITSKRAVKSSHIRENRLDTPPRNIGPPPEVDFFFDVRLLSLPPPPPDFAVTPASLEKGAAVLESLPKGVVSLKQFVPFIPPFFIPLSEALERMPGYTYDVLKETVIRSKAVEIVEIEDKEFIRIFGGYGKVSLEDSNYSEEYFSRYAPSPLLGREIANIVANCREKWIPLPDFLSRLPETLVKQLPFQGTFSVLFFAQMQHLFNFSPDMGGAVLARSEGYTGLEMFNSPTPKLCNVILSLIPVDAAIDIAIIKQNLSEAQLNEAISYFGSLEKLLLAHGELFYTDLSTEVVMRLRYKNRKDIQQRPLQAQLEEAIKSGDKRRIRILRRKLAFRNDPNHPFHDPENLAREVANYLPAKGHISVKIFMQRMIPEELLFYMPRRFSNFFLAYPQHFQYYEYRMPGSYYVCRSGLSLPQGIIRSNFSKNELLLVIGQVLQATGPCTCSRLSSKIPAGARDVIRKYYGGIFYIVKSFPEYFSVILGADNENALASAVVHLIKSPLAGSSVSKEVFSSEETQDME